MVTYPDSERRRTAAALRRQNQHRSRYATLAPSSHNSQCWKFGWQEQAISFTSEPADLLTIALEPTTTASMRVRLRTCRSVDGQRRAQITKARHCNDAKTALSQRRTKIGTLIKATARAVNQQQR
jgi:hypothetical protein